MTFAATAGSSGGHLDETDWQSTAQQQMEVAAQARHEAEVTGEQAASTAGLSSDILAEHSTGRKGPPPAPVFFAWKNPPPTPPAVPQESTEGERGGSLSRDRKNVHTESSDNYIPFPCSGKSTRVPPPADHNILENVTSHPTPVIYESVAHAQMVAAQQAAEKQAALSLTSVVSGSTSSHLKKDYRKSFAPGYFAWPVPQQFPEITPESHENVHTEYRDNYPKKVATGEGTERMSAPKDHNVLGYVDTIDPTVWNSTATSQMLAAEELTSEEHVAGASSAFLAKDAMNLCPPGFFAWPVVAQTAKKSTQGRTNKNVPHSEYADRFLGTAQAHTIQAPPMDHDVIVGCLDADQSAQWQSEAQSQMQESEENAAKHHGEELSLDKANGDYRRSFAPDYFAWPVKDQRAERTAEAASNVHTEYTDSYVHDVAGGVKRVAPPVDHIQLGTTSSEVNAANWKSVASLQNESSAEDYHANGQDIVFTHNQSAQSTPSFFVWPKEKIPNNSLKSTRNCGYGDKVCSEYDSKFVEIDVQNIRTSPVKITQTIPVNDTVDPSIWQSTTQRDMETFLKAAAADSKLQSSTEVYAHPSHPESENNGDSESSLDDKPMNFAWKPLAKREMATEIAPVSTKKGSIKHTTEHRTNFVDWTPTVKDINEHHLAEQESNTNTLLPNGKKVTKRREAKFAGESETHSKFQAWSPIVTKNATSMAAPTSALSGCGATVQTRQTAADRKTAEKMFQRRQEPLLAAAAAASAASSTAASSTQSKVTSGSSSHHSRKEKTHFNAQETTDSAMFSTDSLNNCSMNNSSTASVVSSATASKSTISSVASSRKWQVADDINNLRQASRLGTLDSLAALTCLLMVLYTLN